MADNSVLKGELTFINLADVFQILGGNNSTGILSLSCRYVPHPGLVYFSKGDPIDAVCSDIKGTKAVYSLFGWTEGQFEFREDRVPNARSIQKSRMEIVLDALRLVDDGKIKAVGPTSLEPADVLKDDLVTIKGPPVDYAYVAGEETFAPGGMIIKEKGFGKWISVIYQGTALVKRDTASTPLTIARLGEGAFIGTFRALLFGDYRRTATVFAEDEVHLCSLNSDRIQTEYSSLSREFRNLLLHLDDRLRWTTDRAVALCDGTGGIDDIKDKKIVIKKGAAGKGLFAIRKGAVQIVGQSPKGNLPLLTLKEGGMFGEMPFVDLGQEPRSATVLGSGDLVIDPIDAKSLQDEYEGLSKTMKNMVFHMGNCITMTTRRLYQLHATAAQ